MTDALSSPCQTFRRDQRAILISVLSRTGAREPECRPHHSQPLRQRRSRAHRRQPDDQRASCEIWSSTSTSGHLSHDDSRYSTLCKWPSNSFRWTGICGEHPHRYSPTSAVATRTKYAARLGLCRSSWIGWMAHSPANQAAAPLVIAAHETILGDR